MPSDARILREQGQEALRKHWRDKAQLHTKRYPQWWKDRYPIKTHPCESCGKRVRKTEEAMCYDCRDSRPVMRMCICGKEFQSKKVGPRYYCTPSHAHIGWSIPLTFGPCRECGALFTKRQSNQVFCSSLHSRRQSMREYQRRTNFTAIRYWRIADTPEALELAKTYYQLRQELRRHRG